MEVVRTIGLAGLILLLAQPATSTDYETMAGETIVVSPLDVARLALENGDTALALTIIEMSTEQIRRSEDGLFLYGLALSRASRFVDAEKTFSTILAHNDQLPRVWLELADVQADSGKYGDAQTSYMTALKYDLPADVVARITKRLAFVSALKPFSFNLSIGVAPDTNVNAATSADVVRIFGTEFRVNHDGRPSSGVGLATNGGVRFVSEIADKVFLINSAAIYRGEYRGHRFDDQIARIESGVATYRLGQFYDLAIVHQRRDLAGDLYSVSNGVRGSTSLQLSDRISFSMFAEALHVSHDKRQDLNGWENYITFHPSYKISETTTISLWAGYLVDQSVYKPYASTGRQIGIALSSQLTGRVYSSIAASKTMYKFNDSDPAYGSAREDHLMRLSIYARYHYDVGFGFFPVIRLSRTERQSRHDLYEYERINAMVGIERLF